MREETPQVLSLAEALKVDPRTLRELTDSQFRALGIRVLQSLKGDRQENQLLYYQPVSEIAVDVWRCNTRYQCVGGGNGASKTETMLAKLACLTTGIMPFGMDDETEAAMRDQFVGPINVRVVVASLTTTLYPIILPKLMYWTWTGLPPAGGANGHWGWIPRRLLKQGAWVPSWSDKYRILRHHCVNPDNPDEIIGESTWQFMAHNQEATEFASGDFNYVLSDEPPKYAAWRENEARTMRVDGKMLLSMTWPDDPAIPVDWIFDKLYEPAQPGPTKDPDVSWFEMWTQDNPFISQEGVKLQMKQWDAVRKAARFFGKPIRFSNRVHPDFTDVEMIWCRVCKKPHYGVEACEHCEDDPTNAIPFNHVQDFELHQTLPTICLLDPHPRKPHMLMWVQVDTWDDLWVVAEAQIEGEPDEVKAEADCIEEELSLRVVQRIGDRNMLRSPAGTKRDVSWQDEFALAGLDFELSDVSDVGRGRVNEYLKVDIDREAPRLHIHSRCVMAVRQMLRFTWDEYKHADTRDIKQIPKDKDDDYPTLLKYLLNANPKFDWLQDGAPVLRTR